jgi:hypothetical protein
MSDARLAQTTGMIADVKSQRPDTPMLVSRPYRASHGMGNGGQQARRTRETAYKREDIAQGMPVDRLCLWYLPPAFFSQAGHG